MAVILKTMKRLFAFILLLFSFKTYAQKEPKADSIYFLIDTAKTPVNVRMWDIDSSFLYKNYVIKCPCLKFNGMPTFFYSIVEKEDKGKIINARELKTIKLISLPALILKSKQLLDTEMISRLFFLIEPIGKKYIMHNVSLINPAIKITSPPDVIASKPDTSAFAIKGLIEADAKNLGKYINKSVITVGKVVNFRIVEADKLETLLIGAEYPNQDFTILIKGKNLSNFNPVAFYKGRRLRVVGKVIEFEGKPAIELSDEREIQFLPRIKKQP